MKSSEGRDAIKKIAAGVDVILENFRPGGLAKMGLGYDEISRINKRVVYCSLTGFGQDGPYKDRPSHDLNILSLSGILDMLGVKDSAPIVPIAQFAGASGSLHAVIGILAALLSAKQTGEGCYIDVSLLDSINPFASLMMAQFIVDKQQPQRGQSFLGGGSACYNVYQTSDGRYFSIGCVEPKFWEGFCRAIRREDFIEHLFAVPQKQTEMIFAINEICKTKTLSQWIDILSHSDTCFSPLNTLAEALDDVHIKHRNFWRQQETPNGKSVPQRCLPIKFSGLETLPPTDAPQLGEHTESVLREFGFSAEEIVHLRKDKP